MSSQADQLSLYMQKSNWLSKRGLENNSFSSLDEPKNAYSYTHFTINKYAA